MSESKINIPNFSYPFKEVNKEEEYYKKLSEKETHGNYLFSKEGFWHGGIHFSDSLTDVKATQGIRVIADGELVAYRINSKYLQNDDEKKDLEGLYSNGFFLLRHYFEYPIGNKLTFFSLYMHTAKLSDYDFSTHKMLKKDTIRSVEKYVNSSTGAIEDLEKDTKLTLGELNEYGRYQIVQVDGQKRTGICTVDKGSVIPIEDVLSLKTININTSTDTIIIPPTPIKIKAGEVIGLVGEYNRSKQINRKLLHLEVFTKDDVKSFSDTAKSTYMPDTSEDKPKPIKVIIKNEKNLYAKICECKLDNNSNIREGFSNNSSKYNNETTSKNTLLEVDLSTQQKVGTYTRVKVLKIDTADVSSDNYTVITNVLTDKKDVFKIISEKSIKKEIVSKDIKIEKDSANEKYLLYSNDSNKYVKYSDCIEIHPITFEWARIIDESSDDDISIFSNLHKYLLPEVEDYKKEVLKVSSMYEKLFKEIDTNSNGQIEPQELEEAAKNEAIKKITSKFIVKHSSEWDKTINVPNTIKQILEEHKDNIKNYVKIKDHLDNEEKRVDKLAFFDECSSIDGFPDSDKVFHINPIGLVGQFKMENQLITKEMLKAVCPSMTDKYIEDALPYFNEYAKAYEINTQYRIAHFLSQVGHESCFKVKEENLNYNPQRMKEIFGCKGGSKNYNKNTDNCNKGKLREKLWTQTSTYSNNAENLGSYVYANRMGNGDEASKEGYKFRGRGIIQLTGKNNYSAFMKAHNKKLPNDKQDFVTNPDLIVSTMKYGIESGFYYWADLAKLNSLADQGDSAIKQITLNVNGGYNGLEDRKEKYKAIKQLF